MRVSNPQDYWKALKNVSKNQNENIDWGDYMNILRIYILILMILAETILT